MELNKTNKNNFWNSHTFDDFEQIAFLKDVHSYEISSVCFLKDGRIASSSGDKNALIYNKITFKIEIIIKETKGICYMNTTKDGILIICLDGTFLNLYEINGKKYKNIQTIKPYTLIYDIIGKFDNSYCILKFRELKNGDLVFFVWGYALCFYRKKKKSKKYSYLQKYTEKNKNENITDLIELNNNQYIICFKYEHMIQFLDMNSKKIIKIIKWDFFSYFKNNMILMNENDLFLLGKNKIAILDIQKKEIIKEIKLNGEGHLSSMYKLSYNILLTGYWRNYIQQLEYDEIKKEFKVISRTKKKEFEHSDLYETSSIAIFKNNLIVAPYDNKLGNSSLVIYKYKNE